MIKKFGIKEAQLASKLFKTPEERKTVLKTLTLLGVKNTLKKNIAKARTKLLGKVVKNDRLIVKLNKKYDNARQYEKTKQAEMDTVAVTNNEWGV